MFEVECPDCRHTFDVGDDEQTTRCPTCGLELDLVDPGSSAASNPPDAGPSGGIPQDDEASNEGPFEETPCPHCGGPLLLAPGDESGLCAHCERPLIFEDQKALPFSGSPGPDAQPSSVPSEPAPRNPPVVGFFDPSLEVTTENAPLVECAPVAGSTDGGSEPALNEAPARSSTRSPPAGKKTVSKKTAATSKRSRAGKKSGSKKSAKKGSAGKKRRSSATSKKSKKRGKTTAKKSRGGRK